MGWLWGGFWRQLLKKKTIFFEWEGEDVSTTVGRWTFPVPLSKTGRASLPNGAGNLSFWCVLRTMRDKTGISFSMVIMIVLYKTLEHAKVHLKVRRDDWRALRWECHKIYWQAKMPLGTSIEVCLAHTNTHDLRKANRLYSDYKAVWFAGRFQHKGRLQLFSSYSSSDWYNVTSPNCIQSFRSSVTRSRWVIPQHILSPKNYPLFMRQVIKKGNLTRNWTLSPKNSVLFRRHHQRIMILKAALL